MKRLTIFLMAICFATTPAVMAQDTPKASIGLKGGEFEPDYELVNWEHDFGEAGEGYGEVDVSWIIHPTFEIGIEVGYANYLIPVDIAARYRFNYVADQVLVPFLGAGFDFYRLRNQKVIKEEDRDGDKWKYGLHGAVGIQILLDYFSPNQARDMEKNWGIINTYLNLEAKYSVVDNFGSSDLDLGGAIYTGGLLFEF